MAVQRISYVATHFGGENNADSVIDQGIFGRTGKRKLSKLRGYDLIGWGRAKKRYGYRPYITGAINGSSAGQGVAVHKKGTTHYLVGVAGTKIKVMDKAGDAWTDITGTATLTAGQDVLWTWGHFNDGTDQWLLGCNGVDQPILWDGNPANAVRGLKTFDASLDDSTLTGIVGFDSFHGRPMLFSTNGLIYPEYGTLSYVSRSFVDVDRGSQALAMHKASKDVVYLFFDRDIHYVSYNYQATGGLWQTGPVEDSEPCVSKTSVVTKDGVTYYAGARGIHRLKRVRGPADFIGCGREIQTFWQECNQSRNFVVSHVARGAPWNAVMWLVSYGDSTTHSALIVWNTQIEGWTIYPRSTTDGKLEFNCGVSWPDANGIPRTIMIDYNGIAHEAFGHKYADSGFTDDGALVATEFETGYLDFGYPGVSYTRELILDVEMPTGRTWTLTATPMDKAPLVKDFALPAGGAELDVGFVLDESILAESTVTRAKVKIDRDSGYIKFNLSENSQEPPHVISGYNLLHRNGGMRSTA
jgi:hypothetical protein